MFQLEFIIEKWMPDLLTLSTTFYDASVSRNLFSKAEMRQFGASGTEGLKIFNHTFVKISHLKKQLFLVII